MAATRKTFLQAVCCLFASVFVSSCFSASAPDSKPSWITFSITIPEVALKARLEQVLPAELSFEEEDEKYGIHFRNLKISRKHLVLTWKNGGLEIKTFATASFQFKVGVIPVWEDMTAEMIAGMHLKPTIGKDWKLHMHAEPMLKVTKIGKIGMFNAGNLVAAWLKSNYIQPQVTGFEDFIEQSDFVKTAVEETAQQMADGIKVGGKWEQINVKTFAEPFFSDDRGSLVCQVHAKTIIATPTKHKPKAQKWTGLPPVSSRGLEDELPNMGNITISVNDQLPQTKGQSLNLNLDLDLVHPNQIKGRASIILKKINFDMIDGLVAP